MQHHAVQYCNSLALSKTTNQKAWIQGSQTGQIESTPKLLAPFRKKHYTKSFSRPTHRFRDFFCGCLKGFHRKIYIYIFFLGGGGFCLIKQKCNLWGANTFETSISQMTFSPRLIKRTIYSWERIYCDQMLFVGCQYFWNQYFTNEFFNIDLKKWPLAYV